MLRMFFGVTWAKVLMAAMLCTATPLVAQASDTEEIVALHRQVRALYDQGKYADALTIAERALALAESSLGEEHPDTLNGIKDLVDIYQAQDRFDAEEPFAKRGA
jgi:hypothetical protein